MVYSEKVYNFRKNRKIMEEVILVDEQDNAVGKAEKIAAHREGKLHRAFSAFVFNDGKLLLQKRAQEKYHSGGLWSNTCCGHPRPGEEVKEAAERRLEEEMGFRCALREVGSFVYKHDVGNGLIEYEYDHVLVGTFEDEIKTNPAEAEEWKWMDKEELRKDVEENSQKYTYWLKVALEKDILNKI